MTSDNKTIGIISFIDPQKLNRGRNFVLDKRSDIYSFGMVLWEISSCRKPFLMKNHCIYLSKFVMVYEKNPSKELQYNTYGFIPIAGN